MTSPPRARPPSAPVRSEPRGRPPIHQEEEILEAALRAFATHGYEATSVRSLSNELGLSHGAINSRFQSKDHLYYAAIDHGFETFLAEIAAERARRPAARDELDGLRESIRAFLLAAARRPELGRLMNLEGLRSSDRLDYIVRTVVAPAFGPVNETLRRLSAAGTIHPISSRMLFFLVAHGAEAPFTLMALSASFDAADGTLDDVTYTDEVTDLIMRGMRR